MPTIAVQDRLVHYEKPINLVWVLPRPKLDKFKGGFPRHFEIKLIRLLNLDPYRSEILHPFGGHGEYGVKVDIDPETHPHYVADAHYLSMFDDNRFDLVICDPPYSDKLSDKMYAGPPVKYKQYIKEAVRVCKPEGYVASYHWCMTPRPDGTKLFARIFIGTRMWHRPRVCCIFKKEHINIRGSDKYA